MPNVRRGAPGVPEPAARKDMDGKTIAPVLPDPGCRYLSTAQFAVEE